MASPTKRHEFEQTPGNSEECRSLVPCSPGGHKDSDMTETRTAELGYIYFACGIDNNLRNHQTIVGCIVFLQNSGSYRTLECDFI